jgi:hypothetical protein
MRRTAFAPRASAQIAVALLLCAAACGPRPSAEDASPIDVSQPPEQTPIAGTDPIRLEVAGYDFTVTPLARYVLRGLVVSRENFSSGWNGTLSPCDVAVVWGDLAAGDGWRKLTWSQSGRWYYWRWHGVQPFSNTAVVQNSSNTHVVPASSGLGRAARSLEPGDIAELAGELVRIDGRRGQETVWWRSSLSRGDTGEGSCELLYLRHLRVNGKVYEQ